LLFIRWIARRTTSNVRHTIGFLRFLATVL
jgi:hypothetical protein